MRLVIQRVHRARVEVDGQEVGAIGAGFMVLVGFGRGDTPDLPGSKAWKALQDKLVNLRVFPDGEKRLNRSLTDIGGDLLLVSQFTLFADCRKGRRPSFTGAAEPDLAQHLFHRLCEELRARAPGRLATGEFGAEMDVDFVNWGPVTILLDSDDFAN